MIAKRRDRCSLPISSRMNGNFCAVEMMIFFPSAMNLRKSPECSAWPTVAPTCANCRIVSRICWSRMRRSVKELCVASNLPVLRYRAEPINAGCLKRHVPVEAARDGPVDNPLLLLFQELDQLLLGAHVVGNTVIRVIQETCDRALLMYIGRKCEQALVGVLPREAGNRRILRNGIEPQSTEKVI